MISYFSNIAMLVLKLLFIYFAYLTTTSANPDNDIYFIVNEPISTVGPKPIIPSGYVYHSDIKTAYKINTNRLSWPNAKEACASEGGRIAVIDNPKKLEHIKNMRPWRNRVWTGIYRESASKNWRTVHGGPISGDQPQLHYSPNAIGNCVAIGGLNSSTRLSVLSCDATRRYVCEIPDDVE